MVKISVNLLKCLGFLIFIFDLFTCESLLDEKLNVHFEPPGEPTLSTYVCILLVIVDVAALRALLSILTAVVAYTVLALNGSLTAGAHELVIIGRTFDVHVSAVFCVCDDSD